MISLTSTKVRMKMNLLIQRSKLVFLLVDDYLNENILFIYF